MPQARELTAIHAKHVAPRAIEAASVSSIPSPLTVPKVLPGLVPVVISVARPAGLRRQPAVDKRSTRRVTPPAGAVRCGGGLPARERDALGPEQQGVQAGRMDREVT